ncbi:FAD-dependent catabolic D-arginine dehydrogenase DauA [Mycolicibacterium madagascariense]|uniref:FAD-dependent catabolic D-arginine dehydrogenase DauA n=1 Tax=Mycolicibacterium madagascariense TaxID=212765 RepID=A0A7I7X8Z2_9MYCO|nr:FAD-binding oxidoreductase [Mycolicibacterium madagascariense]MCV7010797.1 FAD-binding oxidoreductase [Mycolicibacterium madagascariense]BBZ26034.1 FAD-dependent catabolic D-arginine dehydrogenase DauA [Mycolicibacterium madagascariense]
MSASDTTADVIVVGGGIAGVSVAYELSGSARVVLLEMESTLAYHTTGRSAALFLETYGGEQIRALTTGSRSFFEQPPDHFDSALVSPRPLLEFGVVGRGHLVESLHRSVLPLVADAELLDADRCCELFSLLRRDVVECGMYEPRALALDVAALHQGFVRGARSNGTEIVRDSAVAALERGASTWTATTRDGSRFQAPVVVDAAGAWADVVATAAGVPGVGLRPLRRTIFMVASPLGEASRDWPNLSDVEESFYANPEGAQFLCSPADETPCAPSDAKPDELEIARAIDAIDATTTLGVRSVSSSWAGLRTFTADRNFALGEDPEAPGFFWLAGQGGYGIQTAPATARLAAALVLGRQAPPDLVDRGLDVERLAPRRVMSS